MQAFDGSLAGASWLGHVDANDAHVETRGSDGAMALHAATMMPTSDSEGEEAVEWRPLSWVGRGDDDVDREAVEMGALETTIDGAACSDDEAVEVQVESTEHRRATALAAGSGQPLGPQNLTSHPSSTGQIRQRHPRPCHPCLPAGTPAHPDCSKDDIRAPLFIRVRGCQSAIAIRQAVHLCLARQQAVQAAAIGRQHVHQDCYRFLCNPNEIRVGLGGLQCLRNVT